MTALGLTADHRKDLEALPPVLRALLEAELAAGNTLLEVGHGFPAAPCGAWFKLARPLLSRPRESGPEIDYYARNTSDYAGEITDDKRHFFILEPPGPPPPEPDMDAIRAGAATAVDCFRQSMVIDYEKWREGIGYDLDILRRAAPEEQVAIESLLLARGVHDWRDVEALAALDSPRARVALKRSLRSADHRVHIAVSDYAPHLVSDDERTASLVRALEGAETYGGLTQALLQVEHFHPPPVVEALFRGALTREGGTAVHYAAMLMFLHGKAASAFDWELRPFFLKFHTADRAERAALLRELCARVGVDAARYLDGPR